MNHAVLTTPQGIAFLQRIEQSAFHDQAAARFAGDHAAFRKAERRQRNARAELLAMAESKPS